MHDLAIIGGTVHDGLGSPGLRADVAIDADRVVAIGRDIRPARRTIEADGRFVAPGFVDAHSHSDISLFDPETIAHTGCYAEPAATPVGIEHVVLGGTVVVDHGGFTEARSGVVLRAGASVGRMP
jgi:N-acyl-D-aspartate/D-glutamate deacylase